MSYGNASPSEPSMKKLELIFGIIVIGAFIILSVFVFPITNFIRDEVTVETTILNKNEGICVVDTTDHPRRINECP